MDIDDFCLLFYLLRFADSFLAVIYDDRCLFHYHLNYRLRFEGRPSHYLPTTHYLLTPRSRHHDAFDAAQRVSRLLTRHFSHASGADAGFGAMPLHISWLIAISAISLRTLLMLVMAD